MVVVVGVGRGGADGSFWMLGVFEVGSAEEDEAVLDVVMFVEVTELGVEDSRWGCVGAEAVASALATMGAAGASSIVLSATASVEDDDVGALSSVFFL